MKGGEIMDVPKVLILTVLTVLAEVLKDGDFE